MPTVSPREAAPPLAAVSLILLSMGAFAAAAPSRPRARANGQRQAAACVLSYTVRIADPAARLVAVDATIAFKSAPGACDLALVDVDGHYTPGYAQFVADVRLFAPTGASVPLTQQAPNRWRPATELSVGRYRLSYTVRVDHSTKPSAWGLKETPTLGADGGVLIGAALFVYPSRPASGDAHPEFWPGRVSLSVSWTLPSTWRVAAPWPETGPATERPASGDDLLDNFVLVSPPDAYDLFETSIGASRIAGAVRRGVWPFESVALWNAFERVTRESGAVFGRMPSPKYLLVVDPMPGTKATTQSTSDGGGAARQSFHAALDEKHTAADLTRPPLLSTLAHETFHWWNPAGLPPAVSADFYWWHEGITVYYAALALWRAGFLAPDEFFAELTHEYERGERRNAARPATSLVEASRKISGEGNAEYDLVYGLGAVFGFALDVEIRRRSGGAGSLDDLLRALYRRYERTHAGFSYDDLVAEASRAAGSDMRPFVDRYATGHERFDWPQILAAVGYGEREVGTGRPVLGIGYDASTAAATVASVVSGAPADGALEPGDVIRAVDGAATESRDAVSRELGRRAPGDRVTLRLERHGQTVDVPVTLGERREVRALPLATVSAEARRLLDAMGRSRADRSSRTARS